MRDQLAPADRDRGHRPRNVQPKVHDPYKRRKKEAGALVCNRCGVVFHRGRWSWGPPPPGAVSAGTCPACQRIEDRYPAGTLRLEGLPERYRDEVLRMIHNIETCEKVEHPLERLMDLEDAEGEFVVTTTGLHLARRIARALERRFHGGIAIVYPEGSSRVQVKWTGGRHG